MNDETSEIDPLWNLKEEFTVYEAAALIVGIDPGYADRHSDDRNLRRNFPGLRPVRSELRRVVYAKTLRARIEYDYPEYGQAGDDEPRIDWEFSTISKRDLCEWLSGKEQRPAFFFPDAAESTARASIPGYLNPQHPRYAPKLAAAVLAWQAVTDPVKRSPKAALSKWLTDHAADLGLSGNGINEAATVANWDTSGGAPRS